MQHSTAVKQTLVTDCGSEPGLISIDKAMSLLLESVTPLAAEMVPLSQACQRTLAGDVFAVVDLPAFSQSAVDGYALRIHGSAPAGSHFTLSGEIRAGQVVNRVLQPQHAVRIFTGGKIPPGTTTVARQEIVQRVSSSGIELLANLEPHRDIRDAGEECRRGSLLAQAGQYLNTGAIAALAMAGVQQVAVYRLPRVVVLITGDEVSGEGKAAAQVEDGKIHDANGPLLSAWFQQRGIACDRFQVKDCMESVCQMLAKLKVDYDLVISTGGVSVGDYDFIRTAAMASDFEQVFWKVNQKPGKPLFFARHVNTDGDSKEQRNCYLLGLPGNPAAVYVAMQLYGKILINKLQGIASLPEWFPARLHTPIKPDKRERLLRMSYAFVNGELEVRNPGNQQSHMLGNLFQSNCLVRVPADESLSAGARVLGLFTDQH
jgi:molybdopterin molybdotransferase